MAHHTRPHSGTKKPLPPHARPSKPAHLTTKHHRSASKAVVKAPLRPGFAGPDDDEESMAASFLQFCANCEKQINVPSNALLYCSESCRKKDNVSQFNYTDYSPPLTPFGQFSLDDLPVRDIVPPRSPTAAPLSNRSSLVYPSDTEPDLTYPETYQQHERKDSASGAERYLRQFQSVTSTTSTSDRQTRPKYNRSQSTNFHSAAPSLSHTPHSISSVAGMPFTPSTFNTARPLPPRKNPYSSSYGSRSTDLVTPFTQLTASDKFATTAPQELDKAYGLKSAPSQTCLTLVAKGEISYEKRETLPVAMAISGSLGMLFAERR